MLLATTCFVSKEGKIKEDVGAGQHLGMGDSAGTRQLKKKWMLRSKH